MRTGRGAPGLRLRPALARRHQAQMEQPAIRHRPRAPRRYCPASCGRTRMTTGVLPIGASVARRRPRPVMAQAWSCRAPGRALRPVLQHDAPSPPGRPGSRRRERNRGTLRGGHALRRSPSSIAATSSVPPRNHAAGSAAAAPAASPAARKPRAASKSPASAASASACIADSASGVFRSSHSASITAAGTSAALTPGSVQRAIEPVQLPLRLHQRRIGEIQRRAVMRAQQQQPHRLAGRPRQRVAQRGEVPQALRHLLAVHQQHAVMHPVAGELAAGERAAALRRLVLVMRKDQVGAAAMDVERLAEIPPRHRAAFDVPARAARGPTGCPSRAGRRRDGFHSTKSPGSRLYGATSTRAPASSSSGLRPDRWPYAG